MEAFIFAEQFDYPLFQVENNVVFLSTPLFPRVELLLQGLLRLLEQEGLLLGFPVHLLDLLELAVGLDELLLEFVDFIALPLVKLNLAVDFVPAGRSLLPALVLLRGAAGHRHQLLQLAEDVRALAVGRRRHPGLLQGQRLGRAAQLRDRDLAGDRLHHGVGREDLPADPALVAGLASGEGPRLALGTQLQLQVGGPQQIPILYALHRTIV